MTALRKITAFIVTPNTPPKLLVFKHPLAGLQLPAGTVDPGEDELTAASREVFEETGLKMHNPGRIIGQQVRTLPPDQAVLLDTVAIQGASFRRGHQVQILASATSNSDARRIRQDIYDYKHSPPKLVSSTEGVVPAKCLTQTIRRTFVLFVEGAQSDVPWLQHADGHTFEVFWTPLNSEIQLVAKQKAWLTSHYELLTELT